MTVLLFKDCSYSRDILLEDVINIIGLIAFFNLINMQE